MIGHWFSHFFFFFEYLGCIVANSIISVFHQDLYQIISQSRPLSGQEQWFFGCPQHKSIHIVTDKIIELVPVVLFDGIVPLQQLSFSIVLYCFFSFSFCHIFHQLLKCFSFLFTLITLCLRPVRKKTCLPCCFTVRPGWSNRKWITSQGNKTVKHCSCWDGRRKKGKIVQALWFHFIPWGSHFKCCNLLLQ